MTPSKTMTTENPGIHNQRSRRRSTHTRNRRSLIYNIFEWAKKNPTKIIAILFGIVLIYVTILFVQYANRQEEGKTTILKIDENQCGKRQNDLAALNIDFRNEMCLTSPYSLSPAISTKLLQELSD